MLLRPLQLPSRAIVISVLFVLFFSSSFASAQVRYNPGSVTVNGQPDISIGFYGDQRWVVSGYSNDPAVTIPIRRAMFDEVAGNGVDYIMQYNIWERYDGTTDPDDDWVLGSLDDAQARGLRLLLDMRPWVDGTEIARRVNLVKNHPALYGYYLDDEPSVPASTLRSHYSTIKANDTNHPVMLSFDENITSLWAFVTGFLDDTADLFSSQMYDIDEISRIPSEISVVNSSDGGGGHIPAITAHNRGSLPTVASYRYQLFGAVAMGANGSISFILEEHGNTPERREEMYYSATRILDMIEPALLKGNGTLGASVTGSSDITYVFSGDSLDGTLVAANHSSSARNGINFTLTGLDPSITQLYVLGEDRMVTLDPSGHFVDNFDGYGVHVYSAIPEPASLTLIATGMFLLILRKKGKE